jgi:hypothetical protein
MGNSSVANVLYTDYVSSPRETSIKVISATLANGGKIFDNTNNKEITIPGIVIWRNGKTAEVCAVFHDVFCLSTLFVSSSTGMVHLSSCSSGIAMDCTTGIAEGIEKFNRESAADTFSGGWGRVELLYEF